MKVTAKIHSTLVHELFMCSDCFVFLLVLYLMQQIPFAPWSKARKHLSWLYVPICPGSPIFSQFLIPTRKTDFSFTSNCWLFDDLAVAGCVHLGGALADRLEDGVVLNVIGVVGLELGGDAIEGALQGLLGRSVNHLGLLEGIVSMPERNEEKRYETHLNTGIIGGPGNKGNLVAAGKLVGGTRVIFFRTRLTYRIPSPEARLYSKS